MAKTAMRQHTREEGEADGGMMRGPFGVTKCATAYHGKGRSNLGAVAGELRWMGSGAEVRAMRQTLVCWGSFIKLRNEVGR